MENKSTSRDGFTRVPHGLLEAIVATPLSGQECRIVWAIIRKTLGFQKDQDRISMGQLSKITGIPTKRCQKITTELVKRKIISKSGSYFEPYYGIQQNFSLWEPPPTTLIERGTPLEEGTPTKKGTPKKEGKGTPMERGRVPQSSRVEVPHSRGDTIDKKDTSKDNTIERFPFDSWQVQLAREFYEQLKANDNLPSKLSKDWQQQWADVLDKCHRIDKRPIEEIRRVALYPQTETEPRPGSDFCWADNFTTLNKLRQRLKNNPDETHYGLFQKKLRRREKKSSQGEVGKDEKFGHVYK